MDLLCDKVLSLHHMHHQGFPIRKDSLCALVAECIRYRDISAIRQLHLLTLSSGLAPAASSLSDSFIHLFGSCGSPLEANLVFCSAVEPTAYTWQALVLAHCAAGNSTGVHGILSEMQEQCIHPCKLFFSSLLKLCATFEVVHEQVWLIHSQIVGHGFEADVVLGSSLVNMYMKSRRLDEAHKSFDSVNYHNVILWGALISGYAEYGHGLLALKLFDEMQQEGCAPDRAIFLSVLKACSCLGTTDHGKLVHNQIVIAGLEANDAIVSSIIDMYAKCGKVKEAHEVIHIQPMCNVISWGALISGYVQNGQGRAALECYEAMRKIGIEPDNFIVSSTLTACCGLGAMNDGRLIHDQIIKSGFELDVVSGTALLDLYANWASLEEARDVFESLPIRNVVSWNSMIAGYAEGGQGLSALQLVASMLQQQMKADKVTFLHILKSCGSIGALVDGQIAHKEIIQTGLALDEVIGSALIDFYAKCASLEASHRVFDQLPTQDSVTYAALIACYVQHGQVFTALQLFEQMQQEGISANSVTLSCILNACCSTDAVWQGRLIHNQIILIGDDPDLVIASALIDMYAKCGSLQEASKVLQKLPVRTTVVWNSVIAGCTQQEQGLLALHYFKKMQQECVQADKITFLSVLRACSVVGALESGKLLHGRIVLSGFDCDAALVTALVDMYARCACLDAAHKLFVCLSPQSLVSWNAMIAGYARHGQHLNALQCLEQMHRVGLEPGDRTHTSVFAACSQVGKVEDGQVYFSLMPLNFRTAPGIEHLNGMIDILCRAGCLQEAVELTMCLSSSVDMTAWTSLLTACRTYGNLDQGRKCFEQMIFNDPNFTCAYVTMSNIFADNHMQNAANCVKLMKDQSGSLKKPGLSWIEVMNGVHQFRVGDESHQQSSEMLIKHLSLNVKMMEEGYIPLCNQV